MRQFSGILLGVYTSIEAKKKKKKKRMFECKACFCSVMVGYFNSVKDVFCERCFMELFPSEVPDLLKTSCDKTRSEQRAPILSSSSSSSSSGVIIRTNRFECNACSEPVFNVLFTCDCEATLLCHACFSALDVPFRCDECESQLSHNPLLQAVLLRAATTRCLGCSKQVRVGSMETHVKKKCSGMTKLLDARVNIILKKTVEERGKFYEGYAIKRKRKD